MSTTEDKYVPCEQCGAKIGEDCVTKNNTRPPVLTHAKRRKLYYKTCMPGLFRQMYGEDPNA